MPEIGATLREARLRRKLDVGELEGATKIRAKYLRALEDEQWDLLPGPTFVKSFLRTYADHLGLDGRVLVEEYRQRYERPTPVEVSGFAPGLGGRRDRRRARPVLTPTFLGVLGVAALLGVLYLLGTWGDDDPEADPRPAPAARQAAEGSAEERAQERRAARRRRLARRRRAAAAARNRPLRLTVRATGTVNVCLVDARGRRLIDSATLLAGQRRGPYASRRFRVTFGNGAAVMRVGARSLDVADSANPIAYELRSGRATRRLPAGSGPTCA